MSMQTTPGAFSDELTPGIILQNNQWFNVMFQL